MQDEKIQINRAKTLQIEAKSQHKTTYHKKILYDNKHLELTNNCISKLQ